MKKTKIQALLLALALPCLAASHPVDSVMRAVERNNQTLKAMLQGAAAEVSELTADNRPEGPSVEYSPFFRQGQSGVASSEMVVSQGFDFPTLYAARAKQVRARQSLAAWRYEAARTELLLQARVLCLDLISLNQKRALLAERARCADELLRLFTKRQEQGDATKLDIDRIRLSRMTSQGALARLEAERAAALRRLQALAGGEQLTLAATDYPPVLVGTDVEALTEQALSAAPELRAAGAAVQAAEQDVRVNRQGWAPRLEVGYRRNTDGNEAANGMLVGASIPLYSVRGRVRAARGRLAEAELQAEGLRAQVRAEVQAQAEQLKSLRRELACYDEATLRSALQTLRAAVERGGLSLISYYQEADAVYAALEARADVERRLQGVAAELAKYNY